MNQSDDSTNRQSVTPLYLSQPAAGFPSPGDDLVEQDLDLNELLIDNKSATFFVRVSGDSMEGEQIFNGDILVVDRTLEPRSGSVVVAAAFGELVVKRLFVASGVFRLESANKSYEPIEINDSSDCYVWGVVTGSIRLFKKPS